MSIRIKTKRDMSPMNIYWQQVGSTQLLVNYAHRVRLRVENVLVMAVGADLPLLIWSGQPQLKFSLVALYLRPSVWAR